MTAGTAAAAVAAGLAAGTINTIVGSGSLVTFPVLLALGLSPLAANVTNSVALVPGGMSAVWGYRRELSGQRRRLLLLVPVAVVGSLAGAALLVLLPAGDFEKAVPGLILGACALVLVQPLLARRLRGPAGAASAPAPAPACAGAAEPVRDGAPATGGGSSRTGARSGARQALLVVAAGLTAVYGGYFGAAQGVILLGVFGILVDDTLQRLNATKNVLALAANLGAAVVFAAVAPVSWSLAGLEAVGTVAGGVVGAHIGRRLPAPALRAVVVAVGLVATVKILA